MYMYILEGIIYCAVKYIIGDGSVPTRIVVLSNLYNITYLKSVYSGSEITNHFENICTPFQRLAYLRYVS